MHRCGTLESCRPFRPPNSPLLTQQRHFPPHQNTRSKFFFTFPVSKEAARVAAESATSQSRVASRLRRAVQSLPRRVRLAARRRTDVIQAVVRAQKLRAGHLPSADFFLPRERCSPATPDNARLQKILRENEKKRDCFCLTRWCSGRRPTRYVERNFLEIASEEKTTFPLFFLCVCVIGAIFSRANSRHQTCPVTRTKVAFSTRQ